MTSKSINCLPTEVMGIIVGYLDWKSVKKASKANANIRYACLPRLFRCVKIALTLTSLNEFSTFTASLAARHVKTLVPHRYVSDQETNCWVLPTEPMKYFEIYSFVMKTYNEEQKLLHGLLEGSNLGDVFRNLPNLSKIVLEYSSKPFSPVRWDVVYGPHRGKLFDDRESFQAHMERLFDTLNLPETSNRLTTLHIKGSAYTDFDHGSNGIQTINLTQAVSRLEEPTLDKLPSFLEYLGDKADIQFPALKKLHLENCCGFTVQALESVCKRARLTLKTLKLAYCRLQNGKIGARFDLASYHEIRFPIAFLNSLHAIGDSCSLDNVDIRAYYGVHTSFRSLLLGEIPLEQIPTKFLVQ
ncbi:hypothetical protein MW887_005833 [Aspergillus wentii]|nr:hypothetical protein MW887_005833 [Aspergillus wentii]